MPRTLLLSFCIFLVFVDAHAQTWEDLNNSYRELFNVGDYIASIPFAEKAVKQAEIEFGNEHQNYLSSLTNLAELYRRIEQFDKALPLYLEALENIKKSLGKDHSAYGISLNNLAELYRSMGQYEKALPLYLESLKNYEKSLGKDHSEYGIGLNNLALLYKSMGQNERAVPLYLEAIGNYEKALGKGHSHYGILLQNLAESYRILGQFEKALPLYLESLANYEKSLGIDHSEYGIGLNNLALLYLEMGQYEKALPLFLESIENTEKSLGKDHSEYGIRLNNLALLYKYMGQYEKALPLYLEALKNTEKSVGKDHPDYGNRLNNLAGLYPYLGQYEKALPLYLEALTNTEKALGKDHYFFGIVLGGLADLYRSMDQNENALPLQLQALENFEKSLGKDHYNYGVATNNVALIYLNMGQYEKALPLFLEALKNTEKSLGKNHHEYGNRLNNLALLYKSMGQFEKALPLYVEASENIEKSLGKDHYGYGMCLINLAVLYENMGQYENALSSFLGALKNTTLQFEQTFSFMSEKEKERFLRRMGNNFEIYQSFFNRYCVSKPVIAGHAFDIELATKGMILQSGIQNRQAILNCGDKIAITKYQEWLSLRGVLARQYTMPISYRRGDLSELEEKAEITEAELSRLSNEFKTVKDYHQVYWKDLQQALKPGELAIEFASFQYRNNKEWTDSTLYMALILRPGDQYPNMVPLFEQKQLDTILQQRTDNDARFITQLYRGAELVNGNETQVNYGKQLYDLIWKPLEPHIPIGSKVYFAPSGSLHQIAFAAIPVDEKQLLSDVYRLEQVSSTAMLLRKNKDKPAMPQNIALFGGIQYDSKTEDMLAQANKLKNEDRFSRSLPEDLSRGSESWSYLSGTLEEVIQIEKLASAMKVKTQTYTDNQALEEQVKALSGAQSPDVLHIATHGFSFPAPQKEGKQDKQTLNRGNNVYRASDNPLQRTGLLFAGANQAWVGKAVPEGLDDGILSAYETSHLYFGNTQLVVLSACETGLGDIKGSEGVFGLQRAFKQAGAEYLMMSLWKVPDKETAEFMASFYEKWFSGQSIPEAFKNTQNQMKKQYPNDPYLWAGFVLVR